MAKSNDFEEAEAKELLDGRCAECFQVAEMTIANPSLPGGKSPFRADLPRRRGRSFHDGLRLWNCDDCDNSWDEHMVVDRLVDVGSSEERIQELLMEGRKK